MFLKNESRSVAPQQIPRDQKINGSTASQTDTQVHVQTVLRSFQLSVFIVTALVT